MNARLKISINRTDLGQILDALDVRAEAWELTLDYLRGIDIGNAIVEDCDDETEAKYLAGRYREIIATIRAQID